MIINKKKCYPIPKAAKILGVSRMTMHRWATISREREKRGLEVFQDTISSRYYVSADSVDKLSKRFVRIS
ncbi:hypothetical protein A3I27_04160 [Candidatus Giovannonibacteria bacterium RIFCSPLOWO2_02_FULL_43_11b]|uniref:Helix-turn-helix domain-containing protein n=1 Tax=Candidatus Giovannonibacteria bacterium RIFCSPHIGHO2_12_FULL_43_15 TaxID=1798341 RepID=A0A1F5WR69_9BACT|nr:MAG: hypothetical protein A2739_00430 [Candidatus Giovannonibacteria bacterium RIFCSPHIGHO2_01_FULL_43_100]OGF78156.1 MAG: hypothetical protein A3F23_03065 [Candidatus Giovannonibacteria bacterium RIFCSPHIGHO2_12_FULL_43_15]OGF89856.1 MAG: hypothetical protein A3I27_04160 [Candidatus Giovannonibacteria bacterium RIFCSPLOWO2_02_FULL_43_11b]